LGHSVLGKVAEGIEGCREALGGGAVQPEGGSAEERERFVENERTRLSRGLLFGGGKDRKTFFCGGLAGLKKR